MTQKRGINPLFGMTDAAFFGKIRAALRRQWMWSEAYKQAIKAATYEFKDGRRRVKVKCSNCGKMQNKGEKIFVPTKKGTLRLVLAYQVDHIDECGSLKNFQDLSSFAERLFTGRQEVLCYHCHSKKEHGNGQHLGG